MLYLVMRHFRIPGQSEIQHVCKIKRHLGIQQFFCLKSCPFYRQHKLFKMIFIDKCQNPFPEFLIGIFHYFLFKFTGFKIPAGKQADQIGNLCPVKLIHKCNPEHIIVFRNINLFSIPGNPFNLSRILRFFKLHILYHLRIKIRFYRQMAEIIHHLTQGIAAMYKVRRHLGHDKIRLSERCPLGIDTDKYLCNLFYIQCVVQFNHTNLAICNSL